MSETEEKPGNWTIRAMPEESRKKALAAANRRGETAAQFMIRAIDLTVVNDAGDRIEMPSQKTANNGANPQSSSRTPPTVDEMLAVAQVMNAALAAYASRNAPVPKRTAAEMSALAFEFARAARGLPMPATRALQQFRDVASSAVVITES